MSLSQQRRIQISLGITLFAATAAFVLWQNAHVAVLWDLSYLLDSSYRIALGQIPYRDFPFAHAPITFLLQAAILRLTGRAYFHHVLYAAVAGATATLLDSGYNTGPAGDTWPAVNLAEARGADALRRPE